MKDARKINIGEGPKEQGGKIFFFLKKNPGAETRRLLKEAPLVEKKKKKKKKNTHINDNWKCHFARRSHGG